MQLIFSTPELNYLFYANVLRSTRFNSFLVAENELLLANAAYVSLTIQKHSHLDSSHFFHSNKTLFLSYRDTSLRHF